MRKLVDFEVIVFFGAVRGDDTGKTTTVVSSNKSWASSGFVVL